MVFIFALGTALPAFTQTTEQCWLRKKELMKQAKIVGDKKNPTSRLGISPLIFLAFLDRNPGIKSISDLAEAIFRIYPEAGRSALEIQHQIIRDIRADWQNGVHEIMARNSGASDEELLRGFIGRVDRSFPVVDGQITSPYRYIFERNRADFIFRGDDVTVKYRFYISGPNGEVGVRKIVTDGPDTGGGLRAADTIEDGMESFIRRFFSKQGLLQHQVDSAEVEVKALGRNLVSYLRRIKSLGAVTSDEGVLRFIAGGDQGIFGILRTALRSGGDHGVGGQFNAAQAVEDLGSSARRLTRGGRGWIVAGSLALVAGVTAAWVTGPDALEKYAEHFTQNFPGTAESPAQAETLSEAFKIQDADTLAQTIYGWGCGNVDALWHAVFDNDGYPFAG